MCSRTASFLPFLTFLFCFYVPFHIVLFKLSTFLTYPTFHQIAEGEEKSGADCQVKIKLIAPPMYVMTCMTLDKELGLETMNHCIEVIATTIRAKGYVLL